MYGNLLNKLVITLSILTAASIFSLGHATPTDADAKMGCMTCHQAPSKANKLLTQKPSGKAIIGKKELKKNI